MVEESTIRSRYEAAGQVHVLDHVPDLSDDEKTKLLDQLDSIEVEKLDSLLKAALEDQKKTSSSEKNITPFSKDVARSNTDSDIISKSRTVGLEAIAQGQVAALVLAGGQGTRLGFDGPKGMYNIGLPSGSTLFELLCRRLGKLRKLAANNKTTGRTSSTNDDDLPLLPFYVMTSPINHQQTVDFFQKHDNFGLADVSFFEQGMLPCMTDPEGNIILETAGTVAMAPDGNGGIYPSLVKSGTLDEMKKRGIKYLHVFAIDNSLARPADPIFVGYCISQKADCGNKVCWKASAHEKVGVVAEQDGKPCIVEYSDISKEMAERTDEADDGRLVFGAANICNHFYTMDFLTDVIVPNLSNLYHVARKKIPYWDAKKKETIKPTTNNGIKLESFIFDVFPLSQSMAVLDVDRAQEFAPVKNAPGSPSDSPDTARMMLSKMFQTWVTEAGGTLTGDVEDSICEISPSISYEGEGLEELVKGKEIECPFHL